MRWNLWKWYAKLGGLGTEVPHWGQGAKPRQGVWDEMNHFYNMTDLRAWHTELQALSNRAIVHRQRIKLWRIRIPHTCIAARLNTVHVLFTSLHRQRWIFLAMLDVRCETLHCTTDEANTDQASIISSDICSRCGSDVVLIKPRLHDTTCCQPVVQPGLTTGCIV